ncbi:MAG: hypothetical protein ACK42H_01465 [Planctomycetota bacterium]|jgi:hypothetical protein
MKKARLLSYMNVSVASAMGMLGLCSQADAGVVYFDVNPDLSLTGSAIGRFGSINLDTGTYTLGSSTGNSFDMDLYYGDARFSGNNISALGVFVYGVTVSRNQSISGSLADPTLQRRFASSLNQTFFAANETAGPTFHPLRLNVGSGNYNYGWVQAFKSGQALVITGFAFEKNVNTPILAGDVGSPSAVPEPGSLAVISGLFGLVVAANRRARKQNQPSMPEALMDLASGAKGVEKLRDSRAV